LEEAGAVGGVHGDELDTDAVTFADAAHNSSGAHLTHGKIQKDLHQAAKRKGLFGADKQAADGKIIDKRNATLRASLPGGDYTLGRFYAGILSLVRGVHEEQGFRKKV
jgi:hypothetical protein